MGWESREICICIFFIFLGGGRGVGWGELGERANGSKSSWMHSGWVVRTGGKNLPTWTRVPSAAVVQQPPPENASFQPKNNNDNGQPSHTSKDTLNRRTLTTTEFLFVKEGKRER